MKADKRRRMIETCDMIADDAEKDVHRYEGMPFTGKTLAEITGEQNAAIHALAKMVKAILEDIG